MQFQKATRQAVKLKLAISGPSGSGKTLGALALAKVLASGGTIALIDTENGSASLYADKYGFDTLNLAPPFTSARYLEAMEAAAEAGYSVLIIDSLSHQWSGEGGILARKEEMDKRPGSNSYTNWATFTKEHSAFLGRVLQLPIHVIGTLRSKQDYVLETNDKGKQQPKKVGMAPVQREGLEYEFSTVFDVQMDHRALASKDRTGLFGDDLVDLVNPSTGKKLLAWLASGAAQASTAPAATTPAAGETALAPHASATAEQLQRLAVLADHVAISDEVTSKIESAIERGTVTESRAATWIAQMEAKIAEYDKAQGVPA
jgi:hypothetical protein